MGVVLVDEQYAEETERARLILRPPVEEPASDWNPPPTQQQPTAPPAPKKTNEVEYFRLLMNLAAILGFRFQLFAAFLGAAAIGAYAVYKADSMSLFAAGLYFAAVYLPALWLAYKRG